MKHNFIRYSIYSMIVLLIGLGVLAASRANAQRRHVNEIDVLSFPWGISSGQDVRINVVNFTSDEPVSAHIQLLDTQARVIAQSEELEVTRTFIKSWSTSGDADDRPVEDSTGGLPVRARISIKFVTEKPFDVNRDRAPFAATVELIDRATGKATLITTEWVFAS
jgi:hypothetical protein